MWRTVACIAAVATLCVLLPGAVIFYKLLRAEE